MAQKDTISEKNHLQLFQELSTVVCGPVGRGVGGRKSHGKGKK
jgi:hypothetical protein